MNVANVAFQRSKMSDRNTPKLRQDPANEVALYEEGFDFVLREIFFIVFGFALPFFVNGQKFSSPFLITNYTEVKSKFILPRSHSSPPFALVACDVSSKTSLVYHVLCLS